MESKRQRKSRDFFVKVPSTLKKWLKFERYGSLIEYESPLTFEATPLKLIPFKCPLNDSHDEYITQKHRHYPEDLFGHYYRQDITLKYVLDLTNTDKYYSTQDLENLNVTHVRLTFPGQTIPDQDYLDLFVNKVQELEKDLKKDEYIGLHCTHGVNRTGYLIIYYLCKVIGVELDKALQAFNTARSPHSLSKEYLLNDLRDRFGKKEEQKDVIKE